MRIIVLILFAATFASCSVKKKTDGPHYGGSNSCKCAESIEPGQQWQLLSQPTGDKNTYTVLKVERDERRARERTDYVFIIRQDGSGERVEITEFRARYILKLDRTYAVGDTVSNTKQP